MAERRDSILYRPSLALANAVGGDAGAALTALVDPDSLSPEEAKTLSQRMGLKGFAGGILDTITDPVVLFGLATSFRWPIPRALRYVEQGGNWVAENFFSLGKKLAKDQEKLLSFAARFRSVHSNFAGTAIPDLFDDFARSRISFLDKFLGKAGDAVRKYETAMGRSMTQAEGILVSAALDGLHLRGPHGFDDIGRIFKSLPTHQAFTELTKDIRGAYDMVWADLFKDPENRERIYKSLKTMQKRIGKAPEIRSLFGRGTFNLPEYDPSRPEVMDKALENYFKKAENYFPHMPSKSAEYLGQAYKEAMIAASETIGSQQGYQESTLYSLLSQVSGSAIKRKMRMLPSLEHLDLVKEYVDPVAYQQVRDKLRNAAESLAKRSTEARAYVEPSIMEYSLDALDTTSKYGHQAASTYAWTVKGIGDAVLETTVQLRKSGDTLRVKQLMDTYIPAMLGKMTYDQAMHAEVWAHRLRRWYNWLDSEPAKVIPGGVRKFLQRSMIDERGQMAIAPLSREMAGYLYVGALGGNVASSVRNLAQLVLTTGPTLGAKYTAVGIKNAFRKAEDYFELRFNKGQGHAEAFASAFKEYHEAGIPGSVVIDDTIGKHLSRSYDQWAGFGPSTAGKVRGGIDAAKKALMSFFTLSENTVRLVTFEGGFAKAMDDGLASVKAQGLKLTRADIMPDAIHTARKIVQNTQFVSGAANSPYMITNWNPLMRQFMHFPLRYLEFLTSTAGTLGSAQTPGGGRNWGTLGRAVLWSELFGRIGMEAFNLDLDQSLLQGAVPWAKSYGPFAPLPLVPPILSVAGALPYDLAAGDSHLTETRKAIPLMVPGGLGAARAIGYVPVVGTGAAKFLGRQYVDYNSPGPDGRYPTFTPNGNLTGFMSLPEILAAATGFGEGGAVQQEEKGIFNMLLKNRDRIRATKREFVLAVTNGDIAGADAIDQEFQQSFNGTSIRKLVSKQDFANEQKRRQITRAEKLLDTLPPAIRPMYAQALQTAMLEMPAEFLGFQSAEAVTRGHTAKQRTAGRATMRDPYTQHMGPFAPGQLPLNDVSFGSQTERPQLQGFSSFDYD